MILLLLLGSLSVSFAAPTYECDPTKVPIVGGNYTVSEEGDVVKYSCPKGKYPYPSLTRECQRNSQWTEQNKKAVCKDVECPRPITFEGGEYAPRQLKYYVGDVLYFECYGGFTMKGPENRTCQENAKWSGKTTICEEEGSYCPNPGIPIGTTKVGSLYRVEDKVTYECHNGLKMIGSKTRQCKEDKTWSGTEPSCRSIYTFDEPEDVAKGFSSSLAETIESSDPDKVEEQKGINRMLQVKKGGLMNIFIVLDASKSVGEKNFKTSKSIAETFIDKVSTYDFEPRYSVLTYASQVKRIVNLSDSDMNTNGDKVIQKIKEFKYSGHRDKEGTNTRAALHAIHEQLSFDNQNNQQKFLNFSNIIILLTDGKYNMGGNPVAEVKRIREILGIRKNHREEKLDIYVFGVGSSVSPEELNDIASKKDKEQHVFLMKDIEAMKKAFDDIIDEAEAFEMCGLSKEHSENVAEKFPWIAQVKITRDKPESCKGSIISKNFILTAAHCFHLDDTPNKIQVNVEGSKLLPVKNIYRHPKYNPAGKTDKNIKKSFDYDLALIELSEKLAFSSKVRPICLPCTASTSWALKQRDKAVSCKVHENVLLTGETVKALFITEEGRGADKKLNRKDVLIKQGNLRHGCLTDAKKVKDFENVIDIKDVVTDNFLCTGGINPEVDPQTCKGDSGGPLIIEKNRRYIQVGVISWGSILSCDANGNRKTPVPAESRDFHARVIQEISWIEEIVKDDLIYVK